MNTSLKSQRKLAAIMFTDIVNYSDMMNRDEKNALDILDKHNKVVRQEFEKFSGKEIKSTGDGFLVKYDSSLDSDKIRSATGISVNWFTPVGPLSFSYAIPISEAESDKTESFRFQIGTSF